MVKKISSYFEIRKIGLIFVVAAMYYLAARAGLLLAFKGTNVTPVWPPSGIALAAALLFSYRIWPGIMLGAFLANLIVFLSNQTDPNTALWASLFISIGNTLSALSGNYLLKKLAENTVEFQTVKQVIQFAVSVLIMCLVSCTIGSTVICLVGAISWDQYSLIWFTWWLGDFSGALIITPLFVLWARSKINWHWNVQILKNIFLFLLVLFISGTIFADWISVDPFYTKAYLIFPLLLWGSFYFDKKILITAVALSASIAIWGTVNGLGTFASPSLNDSLLALQLYISVVGLTIMTLKAIINEREQSEIILRDAQSELIRIAIEKKNELSDYQKRIDNIFKAILKYTLLDFSQKTPLSEKGDEIDAIASGLNTLREELEFHVQKLEESEERFRFLVENIKEYAIFMIDPNGFIVSWNQGAENIKGYTSEEIIGKHIS
ncbi:MAG: MASE1 domain-containing protein, partial [Bacteroidetes bacterium]|nr:MASE1 domain-containing protein [Bacteroidota bacterium]